jgi:Zn2+/Cd2+-exporting ATPase
LLFHEPFGEWFYRALVLLVIACPCALVISTPVTLVGALAYAARRGILIKGGKHIEVLSTVRAIAFDKTGTLTEGKVRVTDVLPLNSLSRDQVLQLVGALEVRSEHPFASAILTEAERHGVPSAHIDVESFEAMPGLGVKATIGGIPYYLGNQELARERGYNTDLVQPAVEQLIKEGKTAVILGKDCEALAILGIRDTARQHVAHALDRLKRLGIRHMVMLSGDHEGMARRVTREVGLEHYAAGLLPSQKVELIGKLRSEHGVVAMVGDGMNDAPALAASSVGIAMGASGSDAVLETADVVLMSDDLSRLPLLFALSRKTLSIIKQNIALALTLKVLFLILSMAGMATLWMAVLADDGAALAVIFNGLRILSYKDNP